MSRITIATMVAVSCLVYGNAFADNVVVTSPAASPNAAPVIDYRNAKAIPLPKAATQPTSQLDSLLDAQSGKVPAGPAGVVPGGVGTGKQSPVTLVAPVPDRINSQGGIDSQQYGTSGQVFTTSETNALGDLTTRYYPFRAAGKLFFKIGTSSYLCSASLIKPGVIVTAAHCVANYGARQFYGSWQFAAAYDKGVAPYGLVNGIYAVVMTSYYNGTDSCYQRGVVCQNDVAVIVLASNVGSSAGYFGYGWNGYSYYGNQALITQLGYPVALDGGNWQERTDSQGFVSSTFSSNTVIGSLQTGGSSGGPWLVNLGIPPSLSGTGFGSAANSNIVVGVTSWGYTSTTIKQQGASPFTSGNIVVLVNAACAAYPTKC